MTWRQPMFFQDSSFPTNALDSVFIHWDVVWTIRLVEPVYLSSLLCSFGGLRSLLLVRVEAKKIWKLHLWEAEKVEPTVVLSLLRFPNLWLLLRIIPTTQIFRTLSLWRRLGWDRYLCQGCQVMIGLMFDDCGCLGAIFKASP